MADPKIAYKKLMPAEGGYANNPNDRGKETYKGIAFKWFPNWPGWKIINALKFEPGFPKNLANHPELQTLVQTFYKENFWDKFMGDKIVVQAVADELFDSAVNMGVDVAVKFLQGSLNLLNRDSSLYPDMKVDGVLGINTLTRLNAFTETEYLLRALNAFQGARYIKICENDSSQEEFFRGWIKRASI
jgi:lysozyme family protein